MTAGFEQMLLSLDRVALCLGQRRDRSGKILSPGTSLLQETNLEIEAGETLGLVGPAGSGKTSLLRLLNRLIEPTQGQLYYQNTAYSKLPIAHLRRQILYVAQEPKLLQPTPLESFRYALHLHGIDPEPRLKSWCEILEISQDLLTQPAIELSLGQRQWISIARALMLETPVLLLDEPTASLDMRMRDRLTEVLKTASNQTLFIASQDLHWLPQLCPQTVVIQHRNLVRSQDWTQISEQLRSSKPARDEEWD